MSIFLSLSLRERGLKSRFLFALTGAFTSLSLRERGLKSEQPIRDEEKKRVALLARAWIEMCGNNALIRFVWVALLARAWIEIRP